MPENGTRYYNKWLIRLSAALRLWRSIADFILSSSSIIIMLAIAYSRLQMQFTPIRLPSGIFFIPRRQK